MLIFVIAISLQWNKPTSILLIEQVLEINKNGEKYVAQSTKQRWIKFNHIVSKALIIFSRL